jgi:hypothetical protein
MSSYFTKELRKKFSYGHNRVRLLANHQKVFCIGLNKTGTTSIKKAFQNLGFIVGDQAKARDLLDAWLIRDFRPIVRYCRSSEAFQDSPFSFPYTYIVLDQAFPNSKFVLTVRDNAEQWYQSITKFHGKLWANGETPSKSDLMAAVNGTRGRPWIVNRALFDSPETEPYRKEDLIGFYTRYINDVQTYFKNRPGDLLTLNVADKNSYAEFCRHLGVKQDSNSFPWENKT